MGYLLIYFWMHSKIPCFSCGVFKVHKANGSTSSRHGCGRPVNPGRHPSGRRYDTCCRGCSSGHHDATCGEAIGGGNCHRMSQDGKCERKCTQFLQHGDCTDRIR